MKIKLGNKGNRKNQLLKLEPVNYAHYHYKASIPRILAKSSSSPDVDDDEVGSSEEEGEEGGQE